MGGNDLRVSESLYGARRPRKIAPVLGRSYTIHKRYSRRDGRPWLSRRGEARQRPSHVIAETLDRVVVDQPSSLHERVTDGRADEIEAALLQILAHRVRFRSARRNSLPQPPGVHSRFATDKLPDIAIERAELLLYRQKCLGVLYGRSYLQPVADDPLIAQQSLRLSPVVARDYFWVEAVKSRAIVSRFRRIVSPAKPGLCALQKQQLEQHTIVVLRHTPFAVVIENRELVARPGTADDGLFRCLYFHVDYLPASTPSILRSSSAENFRFFRAATLSSTCDTLLVPTSALVTRGSRSTHATAISASVCPRCPAISLSARTLARVASPMSFFFRKKSRAARESLGIPFR